MCQCYSFNGSANSFYCHLSEYYAFRNVSVASECCQTSDGSSAFSLSLFCVCPVLRDQQCDSSFVSFYLIIRSSRGLCQVSSSLLFSLLTCLQLCSFVVLSKNGVFFVFLSTMGVYCFLGYFLVSLPQWYSVWVKQLILYGSYGAISALMLQIMYQNRWCLFDLKLHLGHICHISLLLSILNKGKIFWATTDFTWNNLHLY